MVSKGNFSHLNNSNILNNKPDNKPSEARISMSSTNASKYFINKPKSENLYSDIMNKKELSPVNNHRTSNNPTNSYSNMHQKRPFAYVYNNINHSSATNSNNNVNNNKK